VSARAALAVVVLLLLVPCAAAAQTAPDALTDEYPLGEQLRQPTHTAVDGLADPRGSEDDGGPPLWLFLAIPMAVAGALVALGIYARGGPPAAYGYAFDERPRPRRRVSPDLLHALRPLLQYDHRRDAHVLKVVGHRTGPVLWAADEPPEPASPPTGRFTRASEADDRPKAGRSLD
jgi:hypothetical protein